MTVPPVTEPLVLTLPETAEQNAALARQLLPLLPDTVPLEPRRRPVVLTLELGDGGLTPGWYGLLPVTDSHRLRVLADDDGLRVHDTGDLDELRRSQASDQAFDEVLDAIEAADDAWTEFWATDTWARRRAAAALTALAWLRELRELRASWRPADATYADWLKATHTANLRRDLCRITAAEMATAEQRDAARTLADDWDGCPTDLARAVTAALTPTGRP